MDGVLSTLIAVTRTLLGAGLTHLFQRRASARDQAFGAQRELRSERMAVYSDFAGALTEYRRGQLDQWHRKNEDSDSSAYVAARIEAYRLRGLALHALFRVQLIASGQTLFDAAQDACTHASNLHKATDKAELSIRGAHAREALEQFIRLASSDVP
ncbi:hypothetical protein [Streptomyces sp. NBC_00827]|uniref:hypothetical protein n=1 Tax=Streptomyces sp. NBC_00827 TaxID=2903677 RepID=UPI003870475B|nr:hypothetical protein OG569_39425 [Streptomyces sp. NBC_00827]